MNNAQNNVLSNEIKIVALFDYDPTTTGFHKHTHIMFVERDDELSTKVSHMIANRHVAKGGTYTTDVVITDKTMIWCGSDCTIVLIDGVEYVMFRDGSTIKM